MKAGPKIDKVLHYVVMGMTNPLRENLVLQALSADHATRARPFTSMQSLWLSDPTSELTGEVLTNG